MREIVLDTETTGLDPNAGHRIVEIAAIELTNTVPTGRHFHKYANPERDMPEEAFNVHGLSEAFLRQHPTFEVIVDEFLAFIGDATLVIHNADFDMRFINAELARYKRPPLGPERATCTLQLARRRFPGAQASLDALCKRFNIDNSHRTKHGALLDSELLAEVYIELIGGKQAALGLESIAARPAGRIEIVTVEVSIRARPTPLAPRLTEADRAAHRLLVAELGEKAIWLKMGAASRLQ